MEMVEAMLDAALAEQKAPIQYAALIQSLVGAGERPSLAVVHRLLALMNVGARERQDGLLFDMPVRSLPPDRDVLVAENVRLHGSVLHAHVTDDGLTKGRTQPVGSVARAMAIEMPLGQAGVEEVVIYLMHDGGGAVRLYYNKRGATLRTTYLVLQGVLLRQTKVTERVKAA